MRSYLLPERLREKLRRPWGKVILGNKKEVGEKFALFLKKKKFKKIVTVGDFCSQHLFSHLKIFDGKVKRRKIRHSLSYSLSLKNPKGTIQKEAFKIIKEGLMKNKNIFVEGEEDLLVIPAVLLAPSKTLVVYGLPSKGICLIEVNKKTKKKIKKLLEKFTPLNGNQPRAHRVPKERKFQAPKK